MGSNIKTRQINRNIKVLDKTANATEHIRQSYVRTKSNVEQSEKYTGSTDYAQQKIAVGAEILVHQSVSGAKKQGGKIIDVAQKKYKADKKINQFSCSSQSEEQVYQPKKQKSKPTSAENKAAQQRKVQAIKTLQRKEKTIKTARRTEQIIKSTGKGNLKASKKAVKTAERTARITVKTTEQAEKKHTMQTTVKAKEMAVKAVKQAEQAAKMTAKAVVHAVKALIAATKTLIEAILAGGWLSVFIFIIVILFGGFLCITGGDNSATVTPVSQEVQAYEPIIRQYAKQYGIEEYVELIKAIMMQESGGQGLDPMQSSESGYNTKYPRVPNGITNPEYSIECGVQVVKNSLVSAEVKSPVDMDAIKLALQGYNYGVGYIEWAKTNYGGYTLANAAEFSDMKASEMGWDSYGDKQYVPHVLRYYSLGRIPTGIGNQEIVQVALSQEGNSGELYWRWYGFDCEVSWCACFVSWCADQCGYLESGIIPKFSLCSDGANWFVSKGKFKDGSYVPAAGDIIFFDWGSDGSIDHVGIVESVNNGMVNTIEGNSANMVKRNSFSIGDNRIYGYGIY